MPSGYSSCQCIGALSVCPHHDDSERWHQSCLVGMSKVCREEGVRRTVAQRTLDLGGGRDGQAAMWASRGGRGGVQSSQAESPLAHLSHLLSWKPSVGLGCGSPALETDRGGPYVSRPVAVPAAFPPFGTLSLSAGGLYIGHRSPDARSRAQGFPYLFRLKQTKRVKGLIEHLFAEPVRAAAGQGWQGVDTTLQ